MAPTQPEIARGRAVRTLSASDSSLVFLVKTLLYPVLASVPLLVGAVALPPHTLGPYFIVAALAFLVSNVIMDVALIHLGNDKRTGWIEYFDISIRWYLSALLVLGTLYAGSILSGLNEDLLKAWFFATPLLMWVVLRLTQVAFRGMFLPYSTSRKAVIIGAGDVGVRLDTILRVNDVLRTDVQGFFEDRGPERISPSASLRVLGKSSDLGNFIRENRTDVVYITIPMTRQQRIMDLLSILSDSTASIYFVPDLLTFNLVQARIDTLEGLPLIAVCESPFIGLSGLIKRAMDFALAALMIVVATPIFILVAIGVRHSSPGPIILKQTRYGLDGNPIRVYKFRSMAVVEDGSLQNYKQVSRGDPRVTPFGAIIRKTSLDELPQLFNVLEGSMSLVGPRPHVVAVNEQYRGLIPGYMIRHKVKPGITGLAQIKGYRGGDDIESMKRRIEFDLEYLRHWTVGLDLSILLRTVRMVLWDSRAY